MVESVVRLMNMRLVHRNLHVIITRKDEHHLEIGKDVGEEGVVTSNFGSHRTDAGCEARPEVEENSPRRMAFGSSYSIRNRSSTKACAWTY